MHHPVRVAEGFSPPQPKLQIISRNMIDFCELEGLAEHSKLGHAILRPAIQHFDHAGDPFGVYYTFYKFFDGHTVLTVEGSL